MNENQAKMLEDVHRVLLQPDENGDPPMAHQVGQMWKAYQKATWLSKAVVWLVPTAALFVASYEKIKHFIFGTGAK